MFSFVLVNRNYFMPVNNTDFIKRTERLYLPKTSHRRRLADFALDVVAGQLSRRQPLQNGKPDEALWLALDPTQEVFAVDVSRRRRLLVLVQVEGKAAAH